MQTLAGLHSSPVGRERYMEEMPKNYDPSTNEPAILQKWLDGGYYKRREGVGDCTVTIPPPNVTGKLHMGHATDDSIQDAIIRMARMRGRSTRWVLGTDHAGIATQTKVDKKLKSEGISRLEIGRDKFVDACWDWTHEYGGIIVEQIKRMGCSVDFDNERFTMDEDYAQAVRKVFCDWYHDGLIYRGKRIVNWCPNCTTAISDDEAEYKDEKGHLWHLRYPLTEPVNGQDYIVVATTRPETMLGDTGVAVSPKDPEKAARIAEAVVKADAADLPNTDRITVAADGEGRVKITAAGKGAHASMPEGGVNAIGLIVDYLLEHDLCTADERAFFELDQKLLNHTDGGGIGIKSSDEYFGPLTVIGGTIKIEDDRFVQTLDSRFPTSITADEITERLRQLASEIDGSFENTLLMEPFLVKPDSPVIQALLNAYNEATGEDAKPFTMGGGTYAREFKSGASFGPEKPWVKDPEWVGMMHGPDEGVSEDLLKQSFKIYALTLDKLMQLDLQ